MKNILKITCLIILSAALISFLTKKNLIDFGLIQYALLSHLWLIAGVAALQIVNHISMTLRYQSILKILNLDKKTNNVFAATFISNAIGQWLPGSLAFIEIIRLGLMRKTVLEDSFTPVDSSNLAIASLLDRLIGIFVSFLIGSVVTLYFILSTKQNELSHLVLFVLLLFNGVLCVFIVMLPVIAGSKLMQKFLAKVELIALQLITHSKLKHFIIKFFHKINGLIKLFAKHGGNYKVFFSPILLSFGSSLGFAISLEFACMALGESLPFVVILAIISILSVVAALPMSIGGIGFPQLITAILFGAFGSNTVVATSAQLLQTGITLIIISLCGVCYLPRIIKDIIRPRIA